jgi:hypothetical protein
MDLPGPPVAQSSNIPPVVSDVDHSLKTITSVMMQGSRKLLKRIIPMFPNIRRSRKLTLNVPVIVSGETSAGHFKEDTHTLQVNAQGALIELAATVSVGQCMTLKNRASGEEQSCRAVYVESLAEDKAELGIEFLKPAPQFWHVNFPGRDWKAEPETAEAQEFLIPIDRQVQERRSAIRFNFGAVAEVFDREMPRYLIGITRDLSLTGCFVKTDKSLPKGTEVQVRITSSGETFEAVGKVTANISPEGMGIDFVCIEPKDRLWP